MAESPRAARILGVNVDRVIAASFFISSALGGAAGVLFGLAFNSDLAGHGAEGRAEGARGHHRWAAWARCPARSWPASRSGSSRSSWSPQLGGSYRDAVSFAALFLVLVLRPRGLLGAPPRSGRPRPASRVARGALPHLPVHPRLHRHQRAPGAVGLHDALLRPARAAPGRLHGHRRLRRRASSPERPARPSRWRSRPPRSCPGAGGGAARAAGAAASGACSSPSPPSAFGEVVRLGLVNWDYVNGAQGIVAIPQITSIWMIYLALAVALFAAVAAARLEVGLRPRGHPRGRAGGAHHGDPHHRLQARHAGRWARRSPGSPARSRRTSPSWWRRTASASCAWSTCWSSRWWAAPRPSTGPVVGAAFLTAPPRGAPRGRAAPRASSPARCASS